MAENFLLRADPELLDQARKAAEAEGLTVSDFIRQGIALRLEAAGFTSSASRQEVLAEIEHVARLLRAGHVLVPAAEAGTSGQADSWSGLMDPEGP